MTPLLRPLEYSFQGAPKGASTWMIDHYQSICFWMKVFVFGTAVLAVQV